MHLYQEEQVNTSLIKTVTSKNRIVRNAGAVFDTITMPSNVRRLGQNALLHLVAMNNLNFDIHQDLVRNDENFAYGQEWELPDNLDFDQRITILGFGRENLPKMAKDWLVQQGRTKLDSNMQCSICQFEVKCGEEVYDILCFLDEDHKKKIYHPLHASCMEEYTSYASGTICPTCKFSWKSQKHGN